MQELSKSKGFVVRKDNSGDTATEIMEESDKESEKGSEKEGEEAEADSDDSDKDKDSGRACFSLTTTG